MTDLNAYRARKAAARAYHPSMRPIWTPNDAILTAQDFHADIANAERGELVEPERQSSTNLGNRLTFSQSRFRRAKILDGIAVALLMALMAAIGCIVVLASAPTAKADNVSDDVLDYVSLYGEGAVCPVISKHYTTSGLLGVLTAIRDDGFSDYEAGQIVGISVSEYCPENYPLLEAFMARYGGSSVA